MKYKSGSYGEEIVKKDYKKKIIFSLKDFQEKGHQLQIVIVPPNTKQRIHSHYKQTEVNYILEGQAIINVNGKNYLMKPGDAFICSPGEFHNIWNKTKRDFKVLVFKINLPESDDDTNWQK